MKAYEFIQGHETVLTSFGEWPSFHDGEVHRIVLNRSVPLNHGRQPPTLELHLRGWILEEGPERRYELRRDFLVHFLFEDIFDLELEGFNHQNVLTGLLLELINDEHSGVPLLNVELEHCYVFSATFKARAAKVIAVAPFEADALGH